MSDKHTIPETKKAREARDSGLLFGHKASSVARGLEVSGAHEFFNTEFQKLLLREGNCATHQYGDFHSSHELWGVLSEETDEFFDSVKKNEEDLYELLQVCSVGMRYIRQRFLENEQLLDKLTIQQKQRWLL